MTNDELKKKILSIVRGAILEADELPFIETTNNIADALIAAGIGDVKETEHRAEVAERAVYDAEEDIWLRGGAPKEIAKKYSVNDAKERLKKAEKEFQEERKDER